MPIDVLIEGFLFYKSSPQKKAVLMKLFGVSSEELNLAITTLSDRLQVGAIRLVETDNDVQLTTSPELAPIIEALRKNDLKADIGKAGAETLAIILYQEPISRAEIDLIRGVNSSFILRNLLVRGLIERSANRERGGYVFSISTDLLNHLGVTHKHKLPDFALVKTALENFNETNVELTP
jgi:segregation and condensation protein B